jgi:hypothetical protein
MGESDRDAGPLEAILSFRGICKRVADQCGVDASFVSCVIHSKRNSPEVMVAVDSELKFIREHLNRLAKKQAKRPLLQ